MGCWRERIILSGLYVNRDETKGGSATSASTKLLMRARDSVSAQARRIDSPDDAFNLMRARLETPVLDRLVDGRAGDFQDLRRFTERVGLLTFLHLPRS
jgi:hypothetical protein